MARRKHRESFERVVGLPGLFSTGYGSVGSSIYYALGVVALYAMGATPIVLLIAGVLFAVTAWSYAELTAAVPVAGGAASFGGRAFNELVGFCAGWALLLDYVVVSAIAAFFVPHYLAEFWPRLGDRPYSIIAGVVTVGLLAVLNIAGTRQTAWLSWALALLGLATQVLLIVVGFLLLFKPKMLIEQINFGLAPTWKQLLYAIPLGTVAYTGIDALSNMSEEAAEPRRDVPRAINLLAPLVVVLYVGLSFVALSALPVRANVVPVNQRTGLTQPVAVVPGSERGTYVLAADRGKPVYVPVEKQGAQYVIPAQKPTGPVTTQGGRPVTTLHGTVLGSAYFQDPVLGIVAALPDRVAWLRSFLRPWIALLATLILISATNAGLIGSSRVVYAMAQHRQMPSLLGRVHPEHMTPYVGVAIIALVSAALILPGSTALLADLYAFGAMISFTIVHVSVVALRYKEPRLTRPYRVPLSIRVAGGRLPVLSVLGALGTVAIWLAVVATHPYGRVVGLSWMVVGLVAYVTYRRRLGYSLLQPVAIPKLPSTAVADIDYAQILVPIVGSRLTDEMMVLACQLAAEKGASIDAVYVIEVPMSLPLDTPLAAERQRANKMLEMAAIIAAEFNVSMRGHVLVARQAGRAIVELATQRRSQVIIMGAVRKHRIGERIFGDSVTHVLQHAPCEVIVNLVPSEYPMRGSAAEAEASLQAVSTIGHRLVNGR
jgi:APA family basic amino acid/polyamine antiporter